MLQNKGGVSDILAKLKGGQCNLPKKNCTIQDPFGKNGRA
jgi:hypothetical protein